MRISKFTFASEILASGFPGRKALNKNDTPRVIRWDAFEVFHVSS